MRIFALTLPAGFFFVLSPFSIFCFSSNKLSTFVLIFRMFIDDTKMRQFYQPSWTMPICTTHIHIRDFSQAHPRTSHTRHCFCIVRASCWWRPKVLWILLLYWDWMHRLKHWMLSQEYPELLVYILPLEVAANEASQPVSDFHPHRFLFVASLPVPYVLSKIREI